MTTKAALFALVGLSLVHGAPCVAQDGAPLFETPSVKEWAARVVASQPSPAARDQLDKGCGDKAFHYRSAGGRQIWGIRFGFVPSKNSGRPFTYQLMEVIVDTGDHGSIYGPMNSFMFPAEAPVAVNKIMGINWSDRHQGTPFFRLMEDDQQEIGTFVFVGCGDPRPGQLKPEAVAALAEMKARHSQ